MYSCNIWKPQSECLLVLHYTEYVFFFRMAYKTHDFCLILLLASVLYASTCAEEEPEGESVSVDRNSLSSIRLPSKYIIGYVSFV